MGRNARRRAEERDESHPRGLTPDEEKGGEGRDRCPRCGSRRVIAMSQPLGVPPDVWGADVVCLDCNHQWKIGPGY